MGGKCEKDPSPHVEVIMRVEQFRPRLFRLQTYNIFVKYINSICAKKDMLQFIFIHCDLNIWPWE